MAAQQRTAESRVSTTHRPVSRRVLVTVSQDMTTKTSQVVWQHEIPILQSIWGEGNVEQVDAQRMDEGYRAKASPDMLVHNKKQDDATRPSEASRIGFVFTADAEAEYNRLASVYGRHQEVNMPNVEHVYGRFQSGTFERVVGEPRPEDMPDAQLRERIVGFGGGPDDVGFQATPDEKKAAAAAIAEFRALPREKLLERVEALGAFA